MKCGACGYRYKHMEDETVSDDWKEVSDSKEEFEKINGHFTRTTDYHSETEVYLFACPKCGTIKMEKW